MQFREIVGQQAVKKHLIETVKSGRVSHAQLFLGPEGSGSLALAVAYAQYISCENPGADDSCGECGSCRKYSKLIHPDLHFSYPFFAKHKEDTAQTFIADWRDAFLSNPYLGLDDWRNSLEAENKQANINIAECHQILQKLSLKPFEGEYKILIMWLPEYLDKAGNALLKIIEEPPHKTLFLLVSENQDQILSTILSRTQLVKIPALSDTEIESELLRRDISPERAKQIAFLSEGNLASAQNLLKDLESDNFRLFTDWMRMTFGDKGAAIFDFVEVIAKSGRENQKAFLRYGIHFLRECMLMLSGAENLVRLPENEQSVAINFAQKVLTLAKAEAIISELEKAHYHIERNANPKILFLDVSLQFVKILKFNSLPEGTQHIYQ
ncbi:MAG: ATP-binding protein [Sphingobacteriaceae bacterium]